MKIKSKNAKGNLNEIINSSGKTLSSERYAEALNIKEKHNGYIANQRYIVTWALGHLVTNAQPEHYDKTYKNGN